MDYEYLHSIQILALQAVDDPTYDDFYRDVCRWFSATFSTPLKEVEDMADEYVLRHYYEAHYKQVKDATHEKAAEEYQELKSSILATEQERTEAELDDDEWVKEIEAELAKEAAKKATDEIMSELQTNLAEFYGGGEGESFDFGDEDIS